MTLVDPRDSGTAKATLRASRDKEDLEVIQQPKLHPHNDGHTLAWGAIWHHAPSLLARESPDREWRRMHIDPSPNTERKLDDPQQHEPACDN
jgi:hypothetical protein